MSIIPQGQLNRLRASISWSNYPALNVTAPYLSKRGLSLNFGGDATTYVDTMTGAVSSPEPYLKATITAHINKALFLAQSYKAQMELMSYLGGCTVRPDVNSMQPWRFYDCSIQGVDGLDFSGAEADYPVRIGGYYYINSALYNN